MKKLNISRKKANAIETKEEKEIVKKRISKYILRLFKIFSPLILIWLLLNNDFRSKDFKEYMPKEDINTISIHINGETNLRKRDDEFESLVEKIYEIDTTENIKDKITKFFFPDSRSKETAGIFQNSMQSLDEEIYLMEICSLDYCLTSIYNNDINKITLYNIRPSRGYSIEDNIVIIKEYDINLGNIIKTISEKTNEGIVNKTIEEEKTIDYWYSRGWPKKEIDLIKCEDDTDCELYYYGRNINVRDFSEKPYEGINYFPYFNGCWWAAVNVAYKDIWWERYPKPENCSTPLTSYVKPRCLLDLKICQHELQPDRMKPVNKN